MQPSNSFLDTASWQSLDPSSRAARFGKAAEFNFIQQGFLLRRHLKGRHLGIDSSGIESNPSLSWLAGRNTAEICRDYARELPRAAGVKPEALPWSKPSAPWPTGAAGMALLSKRGEKIERRFAHSLDSSVPRRTILRGLAHNNKRYLCVNIGLDLGLILRKGTGVGRPPLPKRPLLAFGRWRRGCLDGGASCAASPRTSWLETPFPRRITLGILQTSHRPAEIWHFQQTHGLLPVISGADSGSIPPTAVCIAALVFIA